MDKNSIRKEPLGDGIFAYVSLHHGFGTDAILLADFAKPKKSDKAVDLGTGCGIIPLLWQRKKSVKRVIGVDISEEACVLAEKSATEQRLDSFSVIHSDLNDLKGKIEFGLNTLVTCNPPYKADGAGIKNPDDVCAAARHEVFCTLEDIISVAARLLQTSGRFCICQRPERMTDIICLMRKYKLEPKRIRLVCQRKGKEAWLLLVEGKKCANSGVRISPTLYIEDGNGNFSPEMVEIYGSYKEAYLK